MLKNDVEEESFLARLRIAQSQLQNLKRQTAGVSNLQVQTAETLPGLEKALDEIQLAEEELKLQYKQLVNAQTRLARERLRYLQLFELAPSAYIVADTQGEILEANQAATTLLQLSATNLYGKSLADFIPEQVRSTFDAHLSKSSKRTSFRSGPPNYNAPMLARLRLR